MDFLSTIVFFVFFDPSDLSQRGRGQKLDAISCLHPILPFPRADSYTPRQTHFWHQQKHGQL